MVIFESPPNLKFSKKIPVLLAFEPPVLINYGISNISLIVNQAFLLSLADLLEHEKVF